MYLKMRTVKSRPPIPNIPEKLVADFYGTCGNGFVGEISIIEDPETKEKQYLYWHDGTWKLFKAFHYHYSGKEQVIIILSNCGLLGEGDEMALKIYQLINNKPYEHILIKRGLAQYVEEEVAMHAGVEAAVGEYLRLKNDTLNFIVPNEEYLLQVGRQVAERGDWNDAIIIFQALISESPEFWEAYDALGETYIIKGDKILAIQSFKKSLELNPQNTHALEMLKKLEKK